MKGSNKTKSQVRRSEERHRALFEQSKDPIYMSTREGRFIDVNGSMCDLFGYTKEEMVETDVGKICVNPADHMKFQQDIEAEGAVRDYEMRFRKRDGVELECLITAGLQLGDDGSVVGYQGIIRDVTERKQMVEALRYSEETYRTIVEEIEEGYYEVDLAGNYIFVNNAACRQFGYSKEELIGMNYRAIIPKENVESVYKAWNKVYRTGEPLKLYPFAGIRKDGTQIFLENSVSPLRNKEGKIIGFRSISRDVTERKKAEEEYQTIIRTAMDGFWLADMQGHFLEVNESYCDLIGYSRDELLNMSITDVEVIERPEETAKHIQKITEVGYDRFETRHRRKDGEVVEVEVSVNYLPTEGGRMIVFLRDITERKRAEEALRESRETLRKTFESVTDGISVIDLNGVIAETNQRAVEIHGFSSKNELLGKSAFELIAPRDREKIVKNMQKAIKQGTIRDVEYNLLRADGSEFPGELSTSVLKDASGNTVAHVTIARDITQRKRMEEERRQLEQKAQITSRLASVGEMSAGIAHEINNPLTGVIGYAQLLVDREDVPRDIRRDLAAINEGAQRVAGIVSRLLAFSRQTKPERRLVDINELIEGTLALRDYHLRVNNIKVVTRLASDLPETVADPGQLQQVFLNLIVNAETEMKLAHDKGKLTVTTEKSDNTIKICFKDNGPGIKPQLMNRIFDPFFTTREVGQGTGLGLSLSYGVVAEHKGKIYAESKPGKGATFVVELPIVTEVELLKTPEPVVEEPERAGRAKILVVDDEQVVRDIVKRVLSDEGYEVDTEDNADDALKKIESKRYNLILLDIKMPGMDGVELYKRIQKIARSLARRVIFITGDVMGADTEKFLSGTKVAHIDKPFNAEQLSGEVKRTLTGGR
jgi:PAS domain S-box-containing protein